MTNEQEKKTNNKTRIFWSFHILKRNETLSITTHSLIFSKKKKFKCNFQLTEQSLSTLLFNSTDLYKLFNEIKTFLEI